MFRKYAPAIAAAAIALSFSQGAAALTVTYNLNISNTTPQFPSGFTWATVKLEDIVGGIQFTVTPAGANPYYTPGVNFGISEFAFMVRGTDPAAASFSLPVGWTVGYGGSADGFGKFDVNLAGGGDRESPLVFSITGANINNYCLVGVAGCLQDEKSSKGLYFAAHIAGFSDALGTGSFWVATDKPVDEYTPPVPLPATVWLLGSALLGLVGVGRRRAN
jgi:hypothetical protein